MAGTHWHFGQRGGRVRAASFVLFAGPMMGMAFFLGLELGAERPNIMSLVHSLSPQGRVGEALGLRTTTIINSSQAMLPLVFGAFGSVLGASAMIWFMATCMCAGGAAAARWRKREEDQS